ncbi:MAG: MBL fold metallo-hydrolase [Chloroflexi bacterium]|nr:MBL fold metallo-hydrolase [Chloroflexota bacterium]MCI0819511.1 MBL fold metallo-hydrolase [Chloroflexota bacterium]MCI0885598.1 MBL fold metallo-hydrolase [Chloroflexota bacterium]
MATFDLEPLDSLTVTVLIDNVTDLLATEKGPVKRLQPGITSPSTQPSTTLEGGLGFDTLLAEHGFSALVTLAKGGRKRTVLYDTGVTPGGMVENMLRMDLSPKDVETIVLSHGHFDHTTGLDGFIAAIGGRANLPVVIHPDFWARRRLAFPGREPFEIPSTSRGALLGAGFEITEDKRPSFVLDGSLLVTGEVDRTTEYEKGFPIHQALRDEEWMPDPLVLDDQALIANVRGHGLVVLTGCGHAGIVNTVRYAQKLTGVDKIAAIIGGFHLNGVVFEAIIPPTVAALREIAPTHIVPAHCTGFPAQVALSAAMPEAFVAPAVGTRLELTAEPE